MSATQFSNLNQVPLQIPNVQVPAGGPKAIRSNFQFGGGITTYNMDLTQNQALGQIDFIQGAYVDNSANSQPVIIICQTTGQNVTVAALTQQYVPLLSGSPPKFIVASAASTALVPIFWYNVPIAPDHWGATGATSVTGLTFDGSGNLNTNAQNLNPLIAGGGLNVNIISGAGSGSPNILTGIFQTTVGGVIYTPAAGKSWMLDWINVAVNPNTFDAAGTARYTFAQLADGGNPIMQYAFGVPAAAPAVPATNTVPNYVIFEKSGMNLKSAAVNNVLRMFLNTNITGGIIVSYGVHDV